MMEIEQPFIEEMREPIRIDKDFVTEGIERHIVVAGTGLFVQHDGKTHNASLTPDKLKLAIKLFAEPDTIFLGSKIVNRHHSAAIRFGLLAQELGSVGLDSHMVSVGRRYGVLSDDKDPALFVERGIQSVIESERHRLNRSRGIEAFKAFEALYEGRQPDRFSRKKILGTAAAVLTIGGVMTYAIVRYKKD